MTARGELTIHPFREGQNVYDEKDQDGRYFIREMIERKNGWIVISGATRPTRFPA